MKDKENEFKKRRDLEKRTFDFSVEAINFLKEIKYSKINDVVKYQLAKAATSIGANYEESQGAYSKEDFKYKISICLREAKESNYWLRIVKATNIAKGKKLEHLIQELSEFKKIFGSTLKKIHYRKDL